MISIQGKTSGKMDSVLLQNRTSHLKLVPEKTSYLEIFQYSVRIWYNSLSDVLSYTRSRICLLTRKRNTLPCLKNLTISCIGG